MAAAFNISVLSLFTIGVSMLYSGGSGKLSCEEVDFPREGLNEPNWARGAGGPEVSGWSAFRVTDQTQGRVSHCFLGHGFSMLDANVAVDGGVLLVRCGYAYLVSDEFRLYVITSEMRGFTKLGSFDKEILALWNYSELSVVIGRQVLEKHDTAIDDFDVVEINGRSVACLGLRTYGGEVVPFALELGSLKPVAAIDLCIAVQEPVV